MISYVVNKASHRLFSESNYGCLIIDFIDERFPLLKFEEGLITKSNYLAATKLWEGIGTQNLGEIDRLEAGDLESWKEGFSLLREALKGRSIILHRASWAKSFKNHDTGEIDRFNDSRIAIVEKNNEMLRALYQYVEENYSN